VPIYPIHRGRDFDMRKVVLPLSVNEVTVEFEHTEAKVKQLDQIVDEMFRKRDWWVWKRVDGKQLAVQGRDAKEEGAVRVRKWDGPTRFREGSSKTLVNYRHHGEGDSMSYVVKALTWAVEKDA
jgi:hypothetical protein